MSYISVKTKYNLMRLTNTYCAVIFLAIICSLSMIGCAVEEGNSEDKSIQTETINESADTDSQDAPNYSDSWNNDDVQFKFSMLGQTFDCAKNRDEDSEEKGTLNRLNGTSILLFACKGETEDNDQAVELEIQVDVGDQLEPGSFTMIKASELNECLASEGKNCESKGKAKTQPEGDDAEMKYVKVSTGGTVEITEVEVIEPAEYPVSGITNISGQFSIEGTDLSGNDATITGSFKNISITVVKEA